MTTLARISDSGCVESFPNGTAGQVVTMVGGEPTWAASTGGTSGVSADANNVLVLGSDNLPYISCEEIQDCIGQAIANGSGLTYDDAINAIAGAYNISITSGTGAPANTVNSPTIYTDTSTGEIYYRDATGTSVKIFDPFTFNVTAGTDANTVVTGPIAMNDGDTLHLWGNTLDFTVVAGSVKLQGEHKPIAKIKQTSKIALTAALDAGESSGNTLTYLWSATQLIGSGAGTVTFSSTTATAPTLTFSEPGSYRITLTATDANGNIDTATHDMKVDRLLTVLGIDSDDDDFATLAAAISWINSNDASNVALYSIVVAGRSLDTTRVTLITARLHFAVNGSLSVGIDIIASGNYHISADSNAVSGISVTSGSAISISATAAVALIGLNIASSDTAANTITYNAGGALSMRNCVLSSAAGMNALDVRNSISQIRIENCSFAAPLNISSMSNRQNILIGCNFTIVGRNNALTTNDSSITISNNRFFFSSLHLAPIGIPALIRVLSVITGNVTISSNLMRCTVNASASPVKGIELGTVGSSTVRISNNTICMDPANGIGIHQVGTPFANMIISQNIIDAVQNSILSTSDQAAVTPLAWNNAPFYNNTLRGPIGNITIAVPTTVLNAGNIQV